MSHLISRIVLTMLMIPLAGVVYLVAFMLLEELAGPWAYNDPWIFIISGAATWGFIAAWWFIVWSRSVRWTAQRRVNTGLSAGAAVLGGAVAAGFGLGVHVTFSALLLSITAPLLWLVATVFVWRETAEERSKRLRRVGLADDPGAAGQSVVCPNCGYDLRGLTEARCPECGSRYTLDELLASQPGGDLAEIEQ